MNLSNIVSLVDQNQGLLELEPQIVGRYYADGNRMGQRKDSDNRTPAYYSPERWIGSSTQASNPPGIPVSGLSRCRLSSKCHVTLKELLAHPELGPCLLGEKRAKNHQGEFRLLAKLLDPLFPIPLHIHADDAFVASHPKVYPNERFGKDEAYHFLDSPKGREPYTHVGVHAGVGEKELFAAMAKGTDHLLEVSPGAYQVYGEGFFVPAGILHRPGTALTLELQQPSDVYGYVQMDSGGKPLAKEALNPGFKSQRAMIQATVNWPANHKNLLKDNRLVPTPIKTPVRGGQVHWIYPPKVCKKFSGLRLTVHSTLKFKLDDPCVLFVWKGQGQIDGRTVRGGSGRAVGLDEIFVSHAAAQRTIEFQNKGDEPLIVYALYAQAV